MRERGEKKKRRRGEEEKRRKGEKEKRRKGEKRIELNGERDKNRANNSVPNKNQNDMHSARKTRRNNSVHGTERGTICVMSWKLLTDMTVFLRATPKPAPSSLMHTREIFALCVMRVRVPSFSRISSGSAKSCCHFLPCPAARSRIEEPTDPSARCQA